MSVQRVVEKGNLRRPGMEVTNEKLDDEEDFLWIERKRVSIKETYKKEVETCYKYETTHSDRGPNNSLCCLYIDAH